MEGFVLDQNCFTSEKYSLSRCLELLLNSYHVVTGLLSISGDVCQVVTEMIILCLAQIGDPS